MIYASSEGKLVLLVEDRWALCLHTRTKTHCASWSDCESHNRMPLAFPLITWGSKCFDVQMYTKSWKTYLRTSILTCHTGGKHSLLTIRYWRFKSRPAREHRVFPTITPSGLSMGTILNMNFSRNSWKNWMHTLPEQSVALKVIECLIII